MTDKKQEQSPEEQEAARLERAFAGMGSRAASEAEREREQRAIQARAVAPRRTGAEDVERERALILSHTEVGLDIQRYRAQLGRGRRDYLADMVRRGYAAAGTVSTGELDPMPYADPDDREHEDAVHGTRSQVVARNNHPTGPTVGAAGRAHI